MPCPFHTLHTHWSGAQLSDLLLRLSGAQALVRRVAELEAAAADQAAALTASTQALCDAQGRCEQLQQQLCAALQRAQTAEAQAEEQAAALRCATPRPRRDLGLLVDLLTHDEAQLAERSLVEGEWDDVVVGAACMCVCVGGLCSGVARL